MNIVRTKASPRRGEQQQWQEVSGESDKLKRSGCNVRPDRTGPVVCLRLAGRVPRWIVWIERRRDQTQRQQQSHGGKENRQDLVAAAGTRNDDARLLFNLCSCGHENSQLKSNYAALRASKYALMKSSMSPLSTASTLPRSSLVRVSFTN